MPTLAVTTTSCPRRSKGARDTSRIFSATVQALGAEPTEGIVRRNAAQEPGAEVQQQFVTVRVTERAVDVLQLVEVAHVAHSRAFLERLAAPAF